MKLPSQSAEASSHSLDEVPDSAAGKNARPPLADLLARLTDDLLSGRTLFSARLFNPAICGETKRIRGSAEEGARRLWGSINGKGEGG